MANDYEKSPYWNPHGGVVVALEGRAAQVGKSIRVRCDPRRPHFGWCNKATVVFLDNGESRTMTTTQINKNARPATGLNLYAPNERERRYVPPPPGAYAFTEDGRFISGDGYGGERM